MALNMLDSFARATLLVTNQYVIWAFLLFGLCFVDKLKCKSVCVLTFFSLAYNPFLKSIFLIPLNPELGKAGFAFPSGHTQLAVACYGTAFILFKNKIFRGLILCALLLTFWGMVYFRFHTWIDIIAGVAFTILSQALYFWSLSKCKKFKEYFVHASMLMLCLLFIVFTHYRAWVPGYMWTAIYGLSVLTLIEILFVWLLNKKSTALAPFFCSSKKWSIFKS